MAKKRAAPAKTNGTPQKEAEKVEDEVVDDVNEEDATQPPGTDAPMDTSEGAEKTDTNTKNDGEDHSGEEDDENEEGKENKFPAHKSLFVKMLAFKKLPKFEDELKLYHKFYTEEMKILAPKIQIPGPNDRWVYFELQSLEDRDKFFTDLKAKEQAVGRNHVMWEGHKIVVKSVIVRAPEEIKDLKRMPIEDAVKVLYPLQDVPYAQQLKDKWTRSKELLDDVIPKDTLTKYTKSKKYIYNVRGAKIRMVPMVPIEGHEYTTTIYFEEDPDTGKIVYGLRAISEDKESMRIVPLDLCISVPAQMKLLVNSFAAQLPEIGLKPYNYVKKEGDLLGITLEMTLCARFVMTVVVPRTQKPTFYCYKQLTPDGVEKSSEDEGEPQQPESYIEIIKKKSEEIKEKIEKYFNEEGKQFSLDSVYVMMSYPTKLKEESSKSDHILGLSFVPDNLNGVTHRLTGDRSRPPIDALRPILGLIEAHVGISSSSRVYLATPYRLLGLYFAKKCAHVTMFYSWTKDNLHELQNWAKKIGISNIDFTSAKAHHRTFHAENAVAVFWQYTKLDLADRLLQSGITNITYISYWNKSPPASYLDQQKKLLEIMYSKLKITHIYPVDLAPFTERIGLGIFFNGYIPFATQQFHRENAPAPPPLLGPRGPNIPAIPFGNRPGPWQQTPEPWGSQLNQFASGVMQNLRQAFSQSYIPSLMDAAPMRPPPPNSSWNKSATFFRNRSEDSWGFEGKRRRVEKGDWKRNYGKGNN